MTKINIKDSLILLTSLGLLICAGLLNEALLKPEIKIEKQQSAININSDFLKFFHAGQSRLISDILWITTLLESDHDHYKQKDLNSWMYLRFKTIATLDPLFLQNYQFGGKYLSIIKDDIYGAKEIFDEGLKLFPNDYELLYNAAFLYAFELGDNKGGSELYEKLITFPQAPKHFKTLVHKLKFEESQNLNLAFNFLSESLKQERDKNIITKIKKDLYAIKAEIDLKCLNNSNSEKCNTTDYEGIRYKNKNGIYTASRPFEAYGLKRMKN